MATLTLSPEAALQPRFIEGIINKKMETLLTFNNFFPVVRTDALSFSWFEDKTTAGADISSGVMSKPADLMELGELTEIEVSGISQQHGSMSRYGYSLRFSQRQLREPAFIDEITRAVDRAAYGMSKKMNDDIVSAWKAVTNDVTEAVSGTAWSDAAATPTEDVLTFLESTMIDGYPYEVTDMFIHQTNYFEIMKYLQGIDINWVLSPLGEGRQVPNINGVALHNLKSGTSELAEGGILGLDSRYPGMTIVEYKDSGLSTMENGHVMVNKYVEERYPYNIVVEMFAERGIATKIPNSLYYLSTGI